MGAAKNLKIEKVERPNIYEYHDYREFLRDWMDYLTATIPKFSIRKLAGLSEIAVGYVSMVMKGERNLTKSALKKMEPHLKLSSSEISYLSCLQVLTDSDHQEERLIALKKMQKFRKYKRKNINEVRAYKFLTKWYYVALREMADLSDFSLDIDWIQKNLIYKISKKEAREAIQFLMENDYVEVNDEGDIQLKEKQLDCVGAIFKIGLTQFHKEMFKLAARSIDLVPSDRRTVTGHTLAISKSQYKKVQEILNNALEQVAAIKNDKSDNEVVYHTSFIAFPLTDTSKKEAGDE